MSLNQRTSVIVVSLDPVEFPFTDTLEISTKVRVDFESGKGEYYYSFSFIRPDTGTECRFSSSSKDEAWAAAERVLQIRHQFDVLAEEVNQELTTIADTNNVSDGAVVNAVAISL